MKKQLKYIHLAIKPKTYERFIKLYTFKENTPDKIINKLMDNNKK
jgi:hypothetical protein